MKRKISVVLAYLLLMTGFLAVCPTVTVQATSNKSEKAYESKTIKADESKTKKVDDLKVDNEDDSITDNFHSDAGWKTTSIGAVKFNAPKKWYVKEGLYCPGVQDEEHNGFYIAIEYDEDGFIKDYVKRDQDNYDDVYVEDDEFDGHSAKFVGYTYYDEKAKFEIVDFIYYIQLSPDGGVCMLVYDAPLEAYEEFIYDYYEVVSSVEIDDSKLPKASPKDDNGSKTLEKSAPSTAAVTDYIANKNTKKFHYPNCSSVSKMSEKNKLYFQGTRDELISQGYDPCQRCKP